VPEARPAATIVVLRPASRGPEILMLRRSARAGFFPHAWVFPGGRVDAADAQVPVSGAIEGLPDAERAFAVAAIRECFEESGVWLGGGTPSLTLRDALNAREATLLDAPGLVADLRCLSWISWWITPEVEPKRFDTRFFLTVLQEGAGEEARHDAVETVSSVWITARAALARHAARDDFFLAPPTFRTLEMLSGCRDAREAAACFPPVVPIQPRVEFGPGGEDVRILLPTAGGPSRIVLRDGAWQSEA